MRKIIRSFIFSCTITMHFTPDIETAKLCVQVLKIAINQLSEEM